MKTMHSLVLTMAASLGFGGCCLPPGPHTPLPPAVVITPPPSHTGHGKGLLTVQLSTRCLPLDVIQAGKFTVSGTSSHRFGLPLDLKPGRYTLTYQRISGFVTPPPTPVEILSGGTTKVNVTYNRQGVSPSRNAGVSVGAKGHSTRAAFTGVLAPGVIVTNPAYQPTGLGNGAISAFWCSSEVGLNPTANLWWVNAASKQAINKSGLTMYSGNTTVNFEPLAGYTAPNPTLIHVWKGQTTTLTVTYGQ